MPNRLSTPVLTVDAAKIHEVDTRNAESLHGMWMVFSKCADYMEQGRRLENLSWRLWNRETFCVPPPVTLRARSRPMGPSARELPELSSSVESAASDDGDNIEEHINAPKPSPLELKPAILTQDSVMSISRGKEKHITSSGLEKMVYNIKKGKYLAPLDSTSTNQQTLDATPRPSSPTPIPQTREPEEQRYQSTVSCSTVDDNDSERPPENHSDTSVSSSDFVQSTSVVRGFSPAHVSSSYRSHTRLPSTAESSKAALPIKSSPLKRTQKGGMFTLGCSSGDEDSSFEDRAIMAMKPQRSSLTDGLARSPMQPKKVASFRKGIETIRPIRESMGSDYDDDDAAIETDYEEISESAIDDDDDSSDWEDSITESGRSSVDEKPLFQRVDSRPNLVSRPSLLTMMMHQPQRYGGPHGRGGPGSRSTPALQRSRLSSPNGPSTAASPDDYDDENTLTMKGPEFPRVKPLVSRPIPCHSIAHSPRTTRRNMLATELTESLRRNLLMERQQKTTSAAAAFRRRHTAHNMANLQEYPGPNRAGKPVTMNGNNNNEVAMSKNSSWNHYFDYGPWEYHDKGW